MNSRYHMMRRKVGGGKSYKTAKFRLLRHKKKFSDIDGHVSMRFFVNNEIRFWS